MTSGSGEVKSSLEPISRSSVTTTRGATGAISTSHPAGEGVTPRLAVSVGFEAFTHAAPVAVLNSEVALACVHVAPGCTVIGLILHLANRAV